VGAGQWDFIKSQIDDADHYVVVVAGKYGSVAADGMSFTEKALSGRKVCERRGHQRQSAQSAVRLCLRGGPGERLEWARGFDTAK
jgi:hypothetical protein